jgi:hypothetical protein
MKSKVQKASEIEGLEEIVETSITRVDGVHGPANGMPTLLMKSLPDDGTADTVASDLEGDVAKAKMSTKEINDLPDSAFAFIEDGGEKDDEGKTTPRSKRHYPVHDKAHADNAMARASAAIQQGGDEAAIAKKAMPKIKAAQKKFGSGVADDGQVKKAGEGPEIPGSPEWEALDAESLRSVATTLAKILGTLDESRQREVDEVDAGADPRDIRDAWDLEDACYCLQQVLGIVARLSFTEATEAEPDGVAKAGKRLSAKSVEALQAAKKHLANAHDQIKGLLGDEDDAEGDDDVKKAELEEMLDSRINPILARLEGVVAKASVPMPEGTKETTDGSLEEEVNRQESVGVEKPSANPAQPPANTGDVPAVAAEVGRQKETAYPPQSNMDDLAKSLAPMLEESFKGALAPLEERLKRIEETPMPGGPLLKGAAPQIPSQDYLLMRRDMDLGFQAPTGATTDEVRKGLQELQKVNPLAADALGRQLALMAHPLAGQ